MTSPTDITKEVVLADLKAHGPSLVKDVTRRLLDLSPKAAKNLALTHTKYHDRVYYVLRSLVALGAVATEVSGTRRAKGQRRGKYYLTGRHKTDTNDANAAALEQVRQAVGIAKDYVRDLFSDERIKNLGLEEVEFVDDGPHSHWRITIGFVRYWKANDLVDVLESSPASRTYKVVAVDVADGSVRSVKHRDPATT